MIPPKLRAGSAAENTSKDTGSAEDDAVGANRNPTDQPASWAENNGAAPKEKKYVQSFMLKGSLVLWTFRSFTWNAF